MSMNEMPAAERVHISFFGCRNAGKSSLVNAVTGQAVSVVSEVKGTTTDPVAKTMELLPLGPVVITDTPGFDDAGGLGSLRVERTRQILRRTDLAVLVVDSAAGLQETDRELLHLFGERNIPFLVAVNKQDLYRTVPEDDRTVAVSALTGEGIRELKERMARLLPGRTAEKHLIADLVRPGDCAVLVCPIDESAPKGRLILPQVQTIRDLLDNRCTVIGCTPDGMEAALASLKNPPKLIITDSQAFGEVWQKKPKESRLTSFSILFAALKGDIDYYLEGAKLIPQLNENSRVLIAECCTHAPQSEDIGRVKIPKLLKRLAGDGVAVDILGGTDFPEDLTPYDLIIQCGACMFNRKYVLSRIDRAKKQGVPMTNYGVFLAFANGILDKISL